MKKILVFIGSALVLLILFAGFYFLGDKHGVENMTFKQVDPTQLATAMQQDHFYSDYRDNTLIVKGTIAQTEGSLVTFKTDTDFKARCQLNSGEKHPRPGQEVSLLSEGGTALRQTDGVLLTDCVTSSD